MRIYDLDRFFRDLGGESLALRRAEQAVKTPLLTGEPLHEMHRRYCGAGILVLCPAKQLSSAFAQSGQSAALIRDQVRAELFKLISDLPSNGFWRMRAAT